MGRWVAIATLLLGVGCSDNLAVPWTGSPEPLYVPSGESHRVNDCFRILSSSGRDLLIDEEIDAGIELFVHETQDTFANSGDQTPLTAADIGGAGQWAFVEAGAVTDNGDGTWSVTLVEAPGFDLASDDVTQAHGCDVPHFSEVTVEAGASLEGRGWNGDEGGLVAVVSEGPVLIDGEIDARNDGFRGGDPTGTDNDSDSVTSNNTSAANGGSKGEGLDRDGHHHYGRGNYANGGGGGNAHNAGGGGGGNGGAGGLGGWEWELASGGAGWEVDTQGMPGVAVDVSPLDRLILGGAGGAGEDHHNTGNSGGDGGGIILIIAPSLSGDGLLAANGEDGGPSDEDGGSGGGAGGTIVLITDAGNFTGQLSARGGDGGNAMTTYQEAVGPGGGGGGGRIYIQGAFGGTTNVDPGNPGQTQYAAGQTGEHGATAGEPGVVEMVP